MESMNVHENVGYLTWDQYERFQNAVNNSRAVISWLNVAGYVKSGEADVRVHSSRDGHIGMPPTSIAAIDLTNMLYELNRWPELADAANDEYGAWLAWTFTRELETANARWPHKPRSHKVQHVRCQACDALTLRWMPPRHGGDTAVIKCTDKACRAVMDESMFAFATHLIATEEEDREKRRLDIRKGRARKSQAVASDDLPVGESGAHPHHPTAEAAVAESA